MSCRSVDGKKFSFNLERSSVDTTLLHPHNIVLILHTRYILNIDVREQIGQNDVVTDLAPGNFTAPR